MTRISLPGRRMPGLENILSENQSILGTIRAVFGLTLKRADRWLRAALPTKAEQVGVAANTPLIENESIAYDADGAALEYCEAFYNASVARIHMAVEQPSATMNGVDRTWVSLIARQRAGAGYVGTETPMGRLGEPQEIAEAPRRAGGCRRTGAVLRLGPIGLRYWTGAQRRRRHLLPMTAPRRRDRPGAVRCRSLPPARQPASS